MRGNFLTQVARFGYRGSGLHLLPDQAQLLLQLIDLLLLTEHGMVQRIEQVFGQAELCFKFSNAGFHEDDSGEPKPAIVSLFPERLGGNEFWCPVVSDLMGARDVKTPEPPS